METTGRQLRLERQAADVTVVAVAAQMGLSRQALWALERSAVVSPERVVAYRRALYDAIVTSRVTA